MHLRHVVIDIHKKTHDVYTVHVIYRPNSCKSLVMQANDNLARPLQSL